MCAHILHRRSLRARRFDTKGTWRDARAARSRIGAVCGRYGPSRSAPSRRGAGRRSRGRCRRPRPAAGASCPEQFRLVGDDEVAEGGNLRQAGVDPGRRRRQFRSDLGDALSGRLMRDGKHCVARNAGAAFLDLVEEPFAAALVFMNRVRSRCTSGSFRRRLPAQRRSARRSGSENAGRARPA